ncbi:MAG: hypothetical protein AAF250_16580 [Pseudomonadota bacterium]
MPARNYWKDARMRYGGGKIVLIVAMVIATSLVIIIFANQQNHKWEYRGHIDQNFLDFIQHASESGQKRLFVDSDGGNVEIAIIASELIQRDGMQVVVREKCFSACASIILASNQNNIVSEGAVIGFHNPIIMWSFIRDYAEEYLGRDMNSLRPVQLSDRALKIYENSGIDPKVVIPIMEGLGLECLYLQGERGRVLPSDVYVVLERDIYVPSATTLSRFNWNLPAGSLPQEETKHGYAEKISRLYPDLTILVEDPAFEWRRDLEDEDVYISRIAAC